jgi:hypothetical protein
MDEVKDLHRQGMSIREIAHTLILHRATVKRYLTLENPVPKRSNMLPTSNILLFEDYILQQILEKPFIKSAKLYQAIKAQDFNGGKSICNDHTRRYRLSIKTGEIKTATKTHRWRPSQVSFLMYKKPDELQPVQNELLSSLRSQSPEIETAFQLFQKFRDMFEKKNGDMLDPWIKEAKTSVVKELNTFAQGLTSDYQAIKNAIIFPWSNGPVEGQINKLKTLKRQIYGRASLNLLRKRLVYNQDEVPFCRN